MIALKTGRLTGSRPVPFWHTIASLTKGSVDSTGPLESFVSPAAVLVPVPKSGLWQEDSLWVPDRLAKSMVQVGLGRRAARLLRRTEALPKAATSLASTRPSAYRHYETLTIQKDLEPVPEIVLVDDVVTRGDTMLGSANRLLESYPRTPIKGFAAIRTVSNPLEFTDVNQPVVGWITLRPDGHCLRRP